MIYLVFYTLLASDAFVPEFLGWSNDGRAAALLQTGLHDGSGFRFAYLEVVSDSGTDRFFYEIACEEGKINPDWAANALRNRAKDYGIPGTLKGTVVGVKMTDSIKTENDTGYTVLKTYACDIGAFTIQETVTGQSEAIGIPLQTGRVEMHWQNRLVFQQELGEHGTMWWVEKAYVRQGMMALILGHHEPGFEGPDTRFSLLVFEVTR